MRVVLWVLSLALPVWALTIAPALAEPSSQNVPEEEFADSEKAVIGPAVSQRTDEPEEGIAMPADEAALLPKPVANPVSAPPVAPNLDLKDIAPVPAPVEAAPAPAVSEPAETGTTSANPPTAAGAKESAQLPAAVDDNHASDGPGDPLPAATEMPVAEDQSAASVALAVPQPKAESLMILGSEVKPGTATRLGWSPDTAGAGLSMPTPVLVINGENPGPTLCLTAAVHGDELNGIEIVRQVMYDTDPSILSGRLIGVPIVNIMGFQQGSRYMPDRRDLNRDFPGDPKGSLSSRFAYSFFNEVIRHCDMLVDIHTGSLKRTNLPQLRADMNNREIAEFTRGFDGMAVVHGAGDEGMLRMAAIAAGIRAVTMEAGESHRIQKEQIKAGVNSIVSLLERQKMISRLFVWGEPEPIYYQSEWLRTNSGGILSSEVELGDDVVPGEVLGVVTDPITNERYEIRAKGRGRIIGMAVDQVVMAGFATYHIGTKARGPAAE